ncbi:MAG: TonB-dependent siderophore receptor [Pseudomonadales bacterium]|nr:TonB-dependent siderophore receptor [Pseudomonadales bacterium]MCP5356791.1 TonB-dependent siderophore receptor [Pseudomonadales bacterium]
MNHYSPSYASQARVVLAPATRGFRRSAVAFAVASSVMAGAQAQQASQASEDAQVIDVFGAQFESEPASMKFRRSLLDTAQTVTVIPESLIEDRAASTLRDVLRNVSGISMQAGEGGTPAGDQMTIRGYSARTDIFVDNVRDFGGYTRDPFNLEQVEVVKGPSSDYSGRGSTGGSINMVSKSARLDDSTSSSVSLGSDDYSRLTLDVNRALSGMDDAAFRLNMLYHDQDTPGRDEVSNKRWGIAPSLGFGIDTDTEVNLSLFHLQQDNVPDYGIPWVPSSNVPLADYADEAPPVDFSNWYGLKSRDFEEIETNMATVQLDRHLGENSSFQNITRWGSTSRDSMITAPRFISNDSTDIRRSDEKYRDQANDILSNQSNLSITLNPGADWEHRILLGAEVSRENEKRYTQVLTGTDSPSTDLFNPNPDDAYLENYQRTGTASNSDSSSVAFYVSDSIEINQHWQINGGLRWDSFEIEYTPDGGTLAERTDRMLSYRGGLVYKPVENGSLYVGYGTSFNPSAEGLTLGGGRGAAGIEDLDPEESRTLEVGTKWQLANRNIFISAAVFHTEKTNARTENPDDPNDLLVLQGEQEVKGFELGLSGRISERINAFAGYTRMDTEITKSLNAAQVGQSLDNSPKDSFNLWSTYAVADKFELGLGAQYVGERYNSTANTRFAPSYWVYEASASYAVNDRLGFRLNVQNLTDEKYIDYVGGGHFIPGLGRAVLLSSSFHF